MNFVDEPRTIFPTLLNSLERRVLNTLSTETGMSRSGVIRTLLLREMASKQLGSASRTATKD